MEVPPSKIIFTYLVVTAIMLLEIKQFIPSTLISGTG
jgi:hypothetical protein